MYILQIEHQVQDFVAWKKTFDNDPLGRERSGVRRHRIFCLLDNPKHVIVSLEFDNLKEAEVFQTSLQKVWGNVVGKLIESPKSRIVQIVEEKQYEGK